MKTKLSALSLALVLTACESPPSPAGRNSVAAYPQPRPVARMPATPAAPPASPVPAQASSQPPPDAQLLYQRRESDAFGSSTYTSRTQVRGPVVEELHIGNQKVQPHQSVYGPPVINGVIQPGYVPSGTTMVYDPVTGRSIPVRRR